jgi:hypothetical protein
MTVFPKQKLPERVYVVGEYYANQESRFREKEST